MILKSGTIIPFIFKDVKKLIAIPSLNKNGKLQFNDVETAIYAAFEDLKNKCEYYNPKIGFQIPETLFIPYLEQRHDLTNFVVKIVETDQVMDNEFKQQNPLSEPQKCIEAECNISTKRDGSEVPGMQIKKLRLDLIDQHLENILKTSSKGQAICKNFENSNELSGEDRLALIELVISCEFKNLVKTKTPIAIDTQRLVQLCEAIVCRFPNEDPSEYFVEHSKSFKYIVGGKLYEHFLEKKLQYIKQMERENRYKFGTADDEVVVELDFPELMELLEIAGDWELFFKAWQYTFDLRMAYFNNSLDPMAYFEKLVTILHDRINYLVDYDFERLYPKKANNLFDNWDQLSERIFTEAHVMGLNDVPLIMDSYGHMSEISGLMMLSYFVENYGRKVKPFEKDDPTNLVIHIESVNGDPEVFFKDYYDDYIQTEPLIVFATGKTAEELIFYCLVGSKLFCMENVLKAVNFCFKCYQILHLNYPDEQSMSWQVIQNVFYDVDRVSYIRNPKATENVIKFLMDL